MFAEVYICCMVKEDLTVHPWLLDKVPAGSVFWARVLGHLQTYGESRRENIPEAYHPHLIIDGKGTFTNTHGSFSIERGDMFCLFPDVTHDFWEDPDDPYSFYWMRLSGGGCEEFVKHWGMTPEEPVLHTPSPTLAIKAFKAAFDYWGRSERDVFEGMALLNHLVAVSRKQPPRRTDADRPASEIVAQANMLMESLLETGLNVTELAGHLGVNRSTLWRVFQKETGRTPIQALNALRLQRARNLLRATDHKIAAIAAMCGFHDEKYFIRIFREHHGRPPGRYRDKNPEMKSD